MIFSRPLASLHCISVLYNAEPVRYVRKLAREQKQWSLLHQMFHHILQCFRRCCVISDDQHASDCSLQAAQPDKAGMQLRQARNSHLPICSQHQSSGLWRNMWTYFCGKQPAWTASAGCMRAGCPGSDCTWPALRCCRISWNSGHMRSLRGQLVSWIELVGKNVFGR